MAIAAAMASAKRHRIWKCHIVALQETALEIWVTAPDDIGLIDENILPEGTARLQAHKVSVVVTSAGDLHVG